MLTNKMRRKDKEITDKTKIDKIINKCEICRLGLSKDNTPYIVPISFGYDGSNIYFHTAHKGQKIDYINSNTQVCLEFETGVNLISNDTLPCKWGFSFQSVICQGAVEELTDLEKANDALNLIMIHYSGKKWDMTEKMVRSVRVWKVPIDSWRAAGQGRIF